MTLETNFFDTATGKLIWSGSFETTLEGSAEGIIKSFVDSALKSLADAQLVRPG